ncbi:uncharacterized protein LY89DRAFT_777432 [Mollisia scopiformis]|uniref:Uncharacterized protein n=1 Tax=Mollisia scopiformis TaxID=149040 RepID=A0A194XQ34_MOLSC|nr:uncharacterized protein LY89DRAFT_777432 [Mollisia scopiformis]KUJ22303.1 hypothetical protein LY89DRAFT_777432 [Mollisia scopiformis]
MGYGTAAIRHINGSYETVAKISGSEQYTSLMQELTHPANFTPDGKRIPSEVSSWKDFALWRSKRRIKKMLGQPATTQTATLSTMVSKLHKAAEIQLGSRIKAAALSQPDAVTITLEEVDNVFDYFGIEDLMLDNRDPLFDQLFATSAAYAGYGKGLCRNYTNLYGCGTEEYFLASKWTLFLDYTESSLDGALRSVQSARMSRAWDTFVEPELGLRRLSMYEDEDAYWAKVEDRIREFVGSVRRPVEDLVLTGESASDPRFLEALRHAFARSSTGQETLEALEMLIQADDGPDFLYATAKGAAEFAKRRQEGMARCLLPEKCRRREDQSENEIGRSEEL